MATSGARNGKMSTSSGEPAGFGDTGETRAADSLTVFWMIAVSIGLIAELGALGFVGLARAIGRPQLETVAGVLVFAAIIMGVVNLALAPLVYYIRRTPPPVTITIAAVVIALLPWSVFIPSLLR